MPGSLSPPHQGTPTASGVQTPSTYTGFDHDNNDPDAIESSILPADGLVNEGTSLLKKSKRDERKERWSRWNRKSKYYIPVLEWMPSYSASTFLGDLVAGITLACLLVPQSLSYASQLAHLDPVNGLFAAIVPSIVYPLLCSGRQVSVGPEAALSLLIGQLVTQTLAHEEKHAHHPLSPARAIEIARTIGTLVTFQAGVITFFAGILRLGFLDAVLSRALLRGFVTAVGVVIFVQQIFPLLGLPSGPTSSEAPVGKLLWLFEHLGETHKLTAFISAVSVATLTLAKIFKPRIARKWAWVKFIPEILIVAVITTVLTDYFNWDQKGVEVLGSVKASSAHLGLPLSGVKKSHIMDSLGSAFTICIVGFVDSIVAAKGEAAKYSYSISPNRELVALGAANIASSFVAGTLPSYGSITRSRLNSSTGARTQMASIITGITVLLATLFLLPFLFYLPKCVLGAIVVMVVFTLLVEAPHDIAFFVKTKGWTELALMTFTFLLTAFWEVKTGIIASVAISLILTVRDAASIRVRLLGRVPNTDAWEPIDPELEGEEEVPGVLVVRIKESLSFANAGGLKERLRRLEMYGPVKKHPSASRLRDDAQAMVFHLGDVENIDPSALQILGEIVDEYESNMVQIWFCHVKASQKADMEKAGIVKRVGNERFLPTVNAVLLSQQAMVLSNIATQDDEH